MDTYISLLLLVVPGFISMIISSYIRNHYESKSDFETTIISLIYSVFIILSNYFLLSLFNKLLEYLKNLKDIKGLLKYFSGLSEFPIDTFFSSFKLSELQKPSNLITYIITTLISCTLISILWLITCKIIKSIYDEITNHSENNYGEVWEHMFTRKDQKHVAISIEKNGKLLGKGFVKDYGYTINKTKDIYLEGEEAVDCLEKIKGTYIDLDRDIVITEYEVPPELIK